VADGCMVLLADSAVVVRVVIQRSCPSPTRRSEAAAYAGVFVDDVNVCQACILQLRAWREGCVCNKSQLMMASQREKNKAMRDEGNSPISSTGA
jgi:hypothetical protein